MLFSSSVVGVRGEMRTGFLVDGSSDTYLTHKSHSLFLVFILKGKG